MSRKTIAVIAASLVSLLLVTGSSRADDIDIFSQNTSITVGAPNVLLILDNRASTNSSFSGSTKFASTMAALATVVTALKTQFNLGIAMYTDTNPGNTSNTKGGYIRFAIQGMTASDGITATDARNCLLKMAGIGTVTCNSSNPYYTQLVVGGNNDDSGDGGMTSLIMDEAYDYFAGIAAYAGNNKIHADPLAFTSGAIAGPTYKSPIAVNNCQKNFIIFINNGDINDSASTASTAMGHLGTAGGDTSIINFNSALGDTANNNVASDEWTRFLNKVSTVQAVTYALEVGPSTNGFGPYTTGLLQSMGRQGKGGYYSAVDAAALLKALTRIFNDIQAVNSVFASASLPLSADNSGAYTDQIYMGVFRPDGQGNPRWLGNLKEYQFAVDSNSVLSVVDKNGLPAAGAKGFAQPDAVSFWTTKDTSAAPDATFAASTSATNGSTGGFWFFDSKGSGLSYDSQDGEWVEKGGAAEQLRTAYLGYGGRGGIGDTNVSTLNSKAARQLYTCTGSCLVSGTALSTTPFDTSNTTGITDTLLGTASASVTAITSATSETLSSIVAGTAIGISSISTSNGNPKTTTIITSAAHGLATNDSVVIAGTGTNADNTSATPWVITVINSTTFTFTFSGGGQAPGPASGGFAYKMSTTATATTTVSHGYSVGQLVTIAGASTGYNGVVMILTAPSLTTFTYTLTSAQGGPAATPGTVTSNVATATAAAHGFISGQSITISGATPTGYNGVWVVTVTGTDTFTYNYTSAAPLASASGTMLASIGGGRTTLIRWVRGQDTQDENGFKVNGADTDVRASIHADVLHSRPVIINYGTLGGTDNPYIFYGSNDGIFRAVKGGKLDTDGTEVWGFIPTEFFGKLQRVYNNSPAVKYPSTPAGIVPTPTTRDYFWDGQTTTYVARDASGAISKALLFITARRGGRFIYALDVTTVGTPKFLWKKGCPNAYPNNTGCDAGFAELGQTWSAPVAVRVHAQTNPVLIFGGGYDPVSEDTEGTSPNWLLAANDNVGRAIYVIDAFTGDPLFTAGQATGATVSKSVSGMTFSIPADVLAMDRNQTGFVDRVYAADVGGNLWRLNTQDADMNNWTVTKLAAIGDRTSATSSRKFFFGPESVVGAAGTFDAVIIASGDREHPLSTNGAQNVVNRVYMFKDTDTGYTSTDHAWTDSCVSGSTCLFDATNTATVTSTAPGWYVTLATGERAVNSPIVVSGEVIFGTNQPDLSNTTCVGNLGIARRYDINYLNGAAASLTDSTGGSVRFEVVPGGGFLPSPIAGVVEITVNGVLTDFPFVIDNPLAGPPPTPKFSVPAKRFRTYWHELLE